MNNKAIIEFGFFRILRILQISEGVIHLWPWWITTYLICRILHISRKPNTIINLQDMQWFLALQVKAFIRTCFINLQGQSLQTASVIYMMEINLFSNGGVLSDPDNLSLKVNTDGVPIFESSGFSLWPIFEINEIPPRKR